jgi:hypothetical protein
MILFGVNDQCIVHPQLDYTCYNTSIESCSQFQNTDVLAGI